MKSKIPISNIEDYVDKLHKTANIIILMLDENANVVYVNSYVERLTGYQRDEIIGKNWTKVFISSLYNKDVDSVFKDIIEEKNMHWGNINEIVCKDNSTKTISWNNSLCFDNDGNFETILSIGSDITELNDTIFQLNEEHEKQKILFNKLNNIAIEVSKNSIVNANQRLFDFFGYKDIDEYKKNINCVCEKFIAHNDYFHLGLVEEGENWIDVIQRLPQSKRIVIMIDKDNETRAFSVDISKIYDDHFLISFDDITDLMITTKKFEYKAFHDGLTGIFNRNKFYSDYEHIDVNETYSLIMFDIDHFKKVNDTFGHDIGDKVLKELCLCVKHMLRDTDIFARWGGEEFMILLPFIGGDEAYKIAERIREKVKYLHVGKLPQITISLGVTKIVDYNDKSIAFKRVDEALYKAKHTGRNKTVIL